MGAATFLVAFVPRYDSIGIWGAVILTILRTLQGTGVGGEWGGSVLIAMEWSRSEHRRGLVAAWPQFGVPAGLFLANLVILGFSLGSGSDFLAWGWRVPFLPEHRADRRGTLDTAGRPGDPGVQAAGRG